MRILITGHTGLVGSNLFSKLIKNGHEVVGISKSDGFDLLDHKKLQKEFDYFKPQVVYMLAANAAESRGQISPRNMTQNNINIFVNTLEAAINSGVTRFIYTSSVSVYGDADVPYKEGYVTKPKDVYGVNKLACEQILKIMSNVYGIEYTIFRPHNIYGPGQRMNDPYRNVVALFMRNIIENKTCTLYDEGRMRRAFSYVDDVVDVLASSLDPQFINKTVNIGSEKAISIKELLDTLVKISGKSVDVQSLPSRKQEISSFLADHDLQRELTSYSETKLEDGLKRTWDWATAQNLGEIIYKENEINV